MPRSTCRSDARDASHPRRGSIEKHCYMTRDAVKRLTLAKKAAAAVLQGGGSISEAAIAAQAFGSAATEYESHGESDSSQGSEAEEITAGIDELMVRNRNLEPPVSPDMLHLDSQSGVSDTQ